MAAERDGEDWRGKAALAIAGVGWLIAGALGATAIYGVHQGSGVEVEAVAALGGMGGVVVGAIATYLGMQFAAAEGGEVDVQYVPVNTPTPPLGGVEVNPGGYHVFDGPQVSAEDVAAAHGWQPGQFDDDGR